MNSHGNIANDEKQPVTQPSSEYKIIAEEIDNFLQYEIIECAACKYPFWQREKNTQRIEMIKDHFSTLNEVERKEILKILEPWANRFKGCKNKFIWMIPSLITLLAIAGFITCVKKNEGDVLQIATGVATFLLILHQYDIWHYNYKFFALYNYLKKSDRALSEQSITYREESMHASMSV